MYWLPKLHKKYIKHDHLPKQLHVLLLNFLNYYPLAALLSKPMSVSIVRKFMKGQVKISFGLQVSQYVVSVRPHLRLIIGLIRDLFVSYVDLLMG